MDVLNCVTDRRENPFCGRVFKPETCMRQKDWKDSRGRRQRHNQSKRKKQKGVNFYTLSANYNSSKISIILFCLRILLMFMDEWYWLLQL